MGDTSASQWYYSRAGQQHGPVPVGTVKQLLQSGQLSPADMVWCHGMAAWSAVGSVPELAMAGAARPVPPIPLGPPAQNPPQAATGPHAVLPIGYASPQPQSPGIGQNAGVRWLLPVGRSGWAIAAGYLGLFSFVVIPAPLALIVSIIAIRDIRKHPQRHGMGRAIFGLVMGILGSVLLCVFLIGSIASRR